MSFVYSLQALAISLILIQLLRLSAKDLHLLDRPNHRKRHSGAIPLIGGLGIFGAIVLSAMVVPGLSDRYGFLLAPALLLLVIGVADDAWDMKPNIKLAGQIVVAVLVLVAQPSLLLTLADGATIPLFWRIMSWFVTIMVIVGTMNAFNMIDGVDGLAGALAAVAVCWILIAAASVGREGVVDMGFQILVPLLVFLHFNARAPWRPRAAVFLGDAGSLLLGFLVAVLGLQMAGPAKAGWSALAICFVVAVPVIDTLSLIARRLHAGRSPFSADREHIHHLLQDAGLSPGQTTAVLAWSATLIGALGLFLDLMRVGSFILLLALIGLFVLHLGLVGLLQVRIQRRAAARPAAAAPVSPFLPDPKHATS
jgi:UDP-GlcNAc:undecaprenyl-phosphate GlcNAc-1-phosphate transferase